jgi:uncharacterized membrane protein HdeD (DUF308 family)
MLDLKLPTGKWLLYSGGVLVAMGLFAVLAPGWAGRLVIYLVGALLLLTGGLQLLAGDQEESQSTRVSRLVCGAIAALAGLIVLVHPLYGSAAIGLVLATFFVLNGVGKIASAFTYRPAQGWWLLLLSGVLALVLAWMIWSQWPLSGEWAIGILVGIELLSTGVALIAIGLTLRAAVDALRERAESLRDRAESLRGRVES